MCVFIHTASPFVKPLCGAIPYFKYEKEKVIPDKYTIIEASRKRVVYNWLQCYSKDSIRSEFEENGFKADELYSDVAGKAFTSESTEIAIVAKKS
jgi:hypothetical protein